MQNSQANMSGMTNFNISSIIGHQRRTNGERVA